MQGKEAKGMVPLPGAKSVALQEAPFGIILVVEDEEDTREMLTMCVELETSYRVLSMVDGVETFERIEEIKEKNPRLFIFDLLLPGLTGLQLYDSLHALKEFEHVPALILTATARSLGLDTEIAARAITLLPKPFDIDELIGRIDHLLTGPGQLI